MSTLWKLYISRITNGTGEQEIVALMWVSVTAATMASGFLVEAEANRRFLTALIRFVEKDGFVGITAALELRRPGKAVSLDMPLIDENSTLVQGSLSANRLLRFRQRFS
ncbi:hypothetical protein HID58_009787 [Brassica napus]|uniref:Uncharacterized protein n=1 Tax=Brassica napus TaxID=3708 RepID=A0ABQ8DTG8_BRANA|nr:hypothetical protein HID58_009787 [Brassica napus]